MAQHGYLREFDEGWDRDDDRGRERSHRDWEDRNDDRGRGFMFGDRERSDRLGDRARQRFSDDDRQWRETHQDDWNRSPRGFRRWNGPRSGC